MMLKYTGKVTGKPGVQPPLSKKTLIYNQLQTYNH